MTTHCTTHGIRRWSGMIGMGLVCFGGLLAFPANSKAVLINLTFTPRWNNLANWPGANDAQRAEAQGNATLDVFQAAQNWQQSITDPFPLAVEVDWNIPLAFGNDDTGVCGVGGILTTQGVAQGFASEKPKTARIILNSNLANNFFYDPTPLTHEEFNNEHEPWHGVAKPNGPADGKVDLLSCAKHEFGHTMGFMRGAAGAPFAPYTAETNDGFLDLTDFTDLNQNPVVLSFPVAGPLNNYDKSSHFEGGHPVADLFIPGYGLVTGINTSRFLMAHTGLPNGERMSMSPFDISAAARVLGLANGQGYNLNGKGVVIPEPATASLLAVGALALMKRRRPM